MINKFIGSHITFFFFFLVYFLIYLSFLIIIIFFPYINMDRCIYTDQIPIGHKGLFTLPYLCGAMGPAVFPRSMGFLALSFWFLGFLWFLWFFFPYFQGLPKVYVKGLR